MHILFLTPQLPFPARQGTSIRNYNLLARLAQRHTIDLLSFLAPGDTLLPDSPLHRHCHRIATVPQPNRSIRQRLRSTLFSALPDMAWRLEAADMHDLVEAWCGETAYDIIQVEGIELAQYARTALTRQQLHRPAFIFDDHNCEYLLQQRNALTDLRNPRRWHAGAYSLVQWAKLRAYEGAVCRRAHACIAVSQPDQAALQRIAPHANITVAPNGIDLAAYAPVPQPSHHDPDHFTLLFTGKMDYRPNIDAVLWFAQEVLPLVLAAAPTTRLQIVGMNPHPRLDGLRSQPNIEITGFVPDPIPYLHAADLFIIPMRVGGGTRFKALEAMAAAKPIVSTTLGVEGIGVTHEHEMLLADAPDEFALAILRVMADQRAGGTLSARLGQNARNFVASRYTWDQIIPIFDHVYAQVLPDHTTTSPRQLISEAN